MKLTKPIVAIIVLLMISFANSEDRRVAFAKNIKKYVQSRSQPYGAYSLVSTFKNKLTLLVYTLTTKEIEEAKIKFSLSDSLINQIKSAPYARASGAIKVEDKTFLNFYSYEETIGSAIKEEDDKISFALIRTKSLAKLKTRYEKYNERECHTVWLFFRKCENVEKQREKVLTEYEKNIVGKAAQYSAIKSILEGVEILKRNDYELYMSDTGTIFSPDQKSVAHVTYFGDIAIGPRSELNAVLPINYEYVDSSLLNNKRGGESNEKTGLMREFIAGNFTEQHEYPAMDTKNLGKDFYFNSGLFHKFNFIVKKNGIPKFPTQYVDYMIKESLKGPFTLEIKKSGNVVLYEEKTKKIIWQTKTANKGKGPYNLHLTNDKTLILQDSNGKILYKSNNYKEIPTIFYGNSGKKGLHVYNGLNLNWDYKIRRPGLRQNISPYEKIIRKPITPKELHIITDNNNKYHITYGGRKKGINFWFEFDNRQNQQHEKYEKIEAIDMFYAKIDDKNFDICYAANLNNQGWTSLACNGEKVGVLNPTSWANGRRLKCGYSVYCLFIYSLVIYIKEKGDPLPLISSNKALIPEYYLHKK